MNKKILAWMVISSLLGVIYVVFCWVLPLDPPNYSFPGWSQYLIRVLLLHGLVVGSFILTSILCWAINEID